MPDINNVAKVKFYSAFGLPTCYLRIDGLDGIFAIMQYSDSFAKNEVPQATVTLGTGTQVNRSLARGFANLLNQEQYLNPEVLNDLGGGELRKARVFLNMSMNEWEPGSDETWNAGAKCIFEGYYAGVGYTRAKSTIQMTVSLVHRLVDLTFSSLFSPWGHPSNAASLIDPAAIADGGNCSKGGAGEKMNNPTAGSMFRKNVENADNLGQGVIDSLICSAETDLFYSNCRDDNAIPGESTPDATAKEVLEAIVSEVGEWQQPLDDPAFKNATGKYVSDMFDASLGNTYWDFLVNKVCAAFLTSLVPFPSKDTSPQDAYAYLVPNMPGYQQAGKELYLKDYTSFQQKSRLWKPLYAVTVTNNSLATAGEKVGQTDLSPECVGGMFPSAGTLSNTDDPTGQLLIVKAPPFLRDLPFIAGGQAYKDLPDTSKSSGDAIGGGDSLPDPDISVAEKNGEVTDVLTKYAKTLYVSNAINGRMGSFSTKLRYDIAPGTILKLNRENPNAGQGNESTLKLPVTNFAQVSRVSHNINAESGLAATNFEVVHVRTEKENEDDSGKFAVTEHPFFTGFFNYAPQIEDWEFG